MIQSDNLPLTMHAVSRCNSRGIRHNMIRKVIENHDVDVVIGGDCRALRISRRGIHDLRAIGESSQSLEHLLGLVVIWSDRTARVVTAFRDQDRTISRRYRRM